VPVAVCTSRRSCRKAGKPRIFMPDRQSSGESRLRWARLSGHGNVLHTTCVPCIITRVKQSSAKGASLHIVIVWSSPDL
jgi:hypothetical protein